MIFRMTPVFETASEKYSWLKRIVKAGFGRPAPNWVSYTAYAILWTCQSYLTQVRFTALDQLSPYRARASVRRGDWKG
jgi:hypothetical protein